jgi:hypothetical protein
MRTYGFARCLVCGHPLVRHNVRDDQCEWPGCTCRCWEGIKT